MIDPPRPTGSLKGQDLGDEYLFYDREGDRVHVLNSTAREIYLRCDGARTAAELAAELVERYGIDEATAQRDVADVLSQLRELGLIAS
jgi:PqqD family protein of HPr-rel-A system